MMLPEVHPRYAPGRSAARNEIPLRAPVRVGSPKAEVQRAIAASMSGWSVAKVCTSDPVGGKVAGVAARCGDPLLAVSVIADALNVGMRMRPPLRSRPFFVAKSPEREP